MAPQTDGPAEDSGVASKLPLPEGMAQHHPRARASPRVVLGGECAANQRIHAEQAEEATADIEALGEPHLAAAGQVKPRRAPREHAGKRLLLRSNLVPLGVSE